MLLRNEWLIKASPQSHWQALLKLLNVAVTPMGLSFSTLFTSLSSLLRWKSDEDIRLLMLGLDSAGKVSSGVILLASFALSYFLL